MGQQIWKRLAQSATLAHKVLELKLVYVSLLFPQVIIVDLDAGRLLTEVLNDTGVMPNKLRPDLESALVSVLLHLCMATYWLFITVGLVDSGHCSCAGLEHA